MSASRTTAAERFDFRELRLHNVSRDFGAHIALHDVTLAVERGEFIALLGPSGCGKSTLLNCIAGLLPLTRGSIWLNDERIDQLDAARRGFNMVFQNYALFPHMTVRRNVAFGLMMRRTPKSEIAERVNRALALVQLTAQAEKLPAEISGGQQQRTAIARAIVTEPRLVLLDEPLSNLDTKLRLEMREEIRRIHAVLGRSSIYVTHDQDEALSLADRIIVLRDGNVRQIDTPTQLYTRPAHVDVAEFMGYRNLLQTLASVGAQGDVSVQIGGATLRATSVDISAPGPATAAIRPDDLIVAPDGPVAAIVDAAEYRGRNFHGSAQTHDGTKLYFCADSRMAPGDRIRLTVAPERVLVYGSHPVS